MQPSVRVRAWKLGSTETVVEASGSCAPAGVIASGGAVPPSPMSGMSGAPVGMPASGIAPSGVFVAAAPGASPVHMLICKPQM